MVVVKFGGTSVGAGPQIDKAARIVHSLRDSKPVVVVSAMSGVTDQLLRIAQHACTGEHQGNVGALHVVPQFIAPLLGDGVPFLL